VNAAPYPSFGILLVDDEPAWLRSLSLTLESAAGITNMFLCQESRDVLPLLDKGGIGLVLLDLTMPGHCGEELLTAIAERHPDVACIIISGINQLDTAVRCMKLGAFDYYVKTDEEDRIIGGVLRAIRMIELRDENRAVKSRLVAGGPAHPEAFADIVTRSRAMLSVFSYIEAVAGSSQPLLITGESGAGKEVVADAIHALSKRAGAPFIKVNCAAIPENLLESELFGHEKGAFTGAVALKKGKFELAQNGTIMLDEIGDMPLFLQPKLLRAVEQKQIERVGGTRPIDIDIRIVAATNKDLKREVTEGTFREDLFFRLNVVTIHLPRLGERREDIAPLASHFLEKYNLSFRKAVTAIDPEAMRILAAYSYPGNVRELENIIERGVALTDGDTLTVGDLPADLRQLSFDSIEGEGLVSLDDMERRYIARVLERTGYNKGLTAQILDIPRTTLWRKLKQYGLE